MRYFITIGIIFLSIICGANIIQRTHASSDEKVLGILRNDLANFYHTTATLSQKIGLLDSTQFTSVVNARNALRDCRLQYKRVSFFLDYYFPNQARLFNAPAKYEAEEPYMEYEDLQGLQLIESLLYDSCPLQHKQQLAEQAMVIKESAADLPNLLFNFSCSTSGIMESARVELIRIMSLYIEGFDAPYLKSGIDESLQAIAALRSVVAANASVHEAKLLKQFDRTIAYLQTHRDFNSFDRLAFLTQYAIPLEKNLGSFIKQNNWYVSSYPQLNYNVGLFDGEVLPIVSSGKKQMIALGKKLFFDKNLSENAVRSCATCHQPDKYFTDGFAKNKSISGDTLLHRNTPSLYYCAFQSAQFWDGRAKNLQTQIIEVLNNKQEMNGSAKKITDRINSSDYKTLFVKAFQSDSIKIFSINHVADAIASYLQTLAPMDSPFDRYMKGDKTAMTFTQKQGFNLFAGKAQCATCHFIPMFNGSTPPFFNKSEYEVLGTPVSDDFVHVRADNDSGRYAYFPIFFYNGAFKTPTLRNARKTAPYMHNGGFSSTEKVIQFYNKGGGQGLQMKTTNQTLSNRPLKLTKKEMLAIDSFLTALTDRK